MDGNDNRYLVVVQPKKAGGAAIWAADIGSPQTTTCTDFAVPSHSPDG